MSLYLYPFRDFPLRFKFLDPMRDLVHRPIKQGF